MKRYPRVEDMLADLEPCSPVFCLRPEIIARTARRFMEGFPGRVLYAVKCNSEPEVLRALHRAGLRDFDVASRAEIALVRGLLGDGAGLYFHNPVKSRADIRAARREHGVRHFVVDHPDEFAKLREVGGGRDLVVLVRLATPSAHARYDLSRKFGAAPEAAAELLRALARGGVRPGLTFHVGSQCLSPEAYVSAIGLCGEVAEASGVGLAVLDVGGGFPAPYPGDAAEPPEAFFAAIDRACRALRLPPDCELLCEPGRALVAEGGSVVVRVLLRKGDQLYVSDGIFGTLSDLREPGVRRPVRLIRPGGEPAAEPRAFAIAGPTCDSTDVLAEPFLLPADTDEGDWIEVGMMGAYSTAFASRFNGFACDTFVTIDGPEDGEGA